MPLVRLHKVLAEAGVASRRASEELILDGRVSVDGIQITELGYKIDPEINQVEVDGEAISVNKSKIYLAFYKPKGILSTMSDPEGRPNLGDFFQGRNDRLNINASDGRDASARNWLTVGDHGEGL